VPRHRWKHAYERDVPTQLRKLPEDDRKAIFGRMQQLLQAENPHELPKVDLLSGADCEGQYRIRQGDYRIRFTVEPGEVVLAKYTLKGIIRFIAVQHRRDVYKDC
jgi:mRNA-degrading endonuclease RelE of RelBE toxin-antitoxin system